jgi:WD40 repeat protein
VPTYQSKEVQFWDPETGKELHRLDIASENANHLVFSPDSKRLAVRMASRIRVWNVDSWKEASVDDAGHREGVFHIVCSPHDGLVVTISDDGSARIWELTTGRQRAALHHSYWVRGVAVSPDGKRIATSSHDDTVRLWDMATAKEIFKLAGHGRMGGSRVLGFSPDGKRLASWGDDWYLRVFDTAIGKALVEHKIRPTDVEVPEDDDDDITRIRRREIMMAQGALTPDLKRFVIGAGASLYVFDVESGKETLRINANEDGLISNLVVSPDNTRLLVGASGGSHQVKNPDGSIGSRSTGPTVRIWDLATGKQVLRNVLTDSWIGQVAFSPDGKTFAAAVIGRRSAAYVWDSNSGEEVHVIDCPLTDAHGVAFSPDGKLLVVGRTDTTALVYDLAALAALPKTKKP